MIVILRFKFNTFNIWIIKPSFFEFEIIILRKMMITGTQAIYLYCRGQRGISI
jgi:hypothetical protein